MTRRHRRGSTVGPRVHTARMSPCPTPEKVRYRDGIAAKLALMKIGRQDKDGHHENRPYRCPCGGWHLTSKPKRRARTAAAKVNPTKEATWPIT